MKEKILQAVSKLCGRKVIDEEADLFDDLGFNSADTIGLIIELEHIFGICIKDEDLNMDNFKNVLSISRLVGSYHDRVN